MAQNTYFRMRPVAAEAKQIDGTHDGIQQVIDWVNDNTPGFDPRNSGTWRVSSYYGEVTLRTPEGEMTATKGDWVVLLGGEFRTFNSKIFKLLCEPV
jgi:hypothetical protein